MARNKANQYQANGYTATTARSHSPRSLIAADRSIQSKHMLALTATAERSKKEARCRNRPDEVQKMPLQKTQRCRQEIQRQHPQTNTIPEARQTTHT
jgi:hypothetical protein